MPDNVTIFTNKRNFIDKIKSQLKPLAFIPYKTKNELSVFDIDVELQQPNCDDLIFSISDSYVFTGPSFAKARGDMTTREIQNCSVGGIHFYIDVNNVPDGHCNIKPTDNLEFDLDRARELSKIARLKIRK